MACINPINLKRVKPEDDSDHYGDESTESQALMDKSLEDYQSPSVIGKSHVRRSISNRRAKKYSTGKYQYNSIVESHHINDISEGIHLSAMSENLQQPDLANPVSESQIHRVSEESNINDNIDLNQNLNSMNSDDVSIVVDDIGDPDGNNKNDDLINSQSNQQNLNLLANDSEEANLLQHDDTASEHFDEANFDQELGNNSDTEYEQSNINFRQINHNPDLIYRTSNNNIIIASGAILLTFICMLMFLNSDNKDRSHSTLTSPNKLKDGSESISSSKKSQDDNDSQQKVNDKVFKVNTQIVSPEIVNDQNRHSTDGINTSDDKSNTNSVSAASNSESKDSDSTLQEYQSNSQKKDQYQQQFEPPKVNIVFFNMLKNSVADVEMPRYMILPEKEIPKNLLPIEKGFKRMVKELTKYHNKFFAGEIACDYEDFKASKTPNSQWQQQQYFPIRAMNAVDKDDKQCFQDNLYSGSDNEKLGIKSCHIQRIRFTWGSHKSSINGKLTQAQDGEELLNELNQECINMANGASSTTGSDNGDTQLQSVSDTVTSDSAVTKKDNISNKKITSKGVQPGLVTLSTTIPGFEGQKVLVGDFRSASAKRLSLKKNSKNKLKTAKILNKDDGDGDGEDRRRSLRGRGISMKICLS